MRLFIHLAVQCAAILAVSGVPPRNKRSTDGVSVSVGVPSYGKYCVLWCQYPPNSGQFICCEDIPKPPNPTTGNNSDPMVDPEECVDFDKGNCNSDYVKGLCPILCQDPTVDPKECGDFDKGNCNSDYVKGLCPILCQDLRVDPEECGDFDKGNCKSDYVKGLCPILCQDPTVDPEECGDFDKGNCNSDYVKGLCPILCQGIPKVQKLSCPIDARTPGSCTPDFNVDELVSTHPLKKCDCKLNEPCSDCPQGLYCCKDACAPHPVCKHPIPIVCTPSRAKQNFSN